LTRIVMHADWVNTRLFFNNRRRLSMFHHLYFALSKFRFAVKKIDRRGAAVASLQSAEVACRSVICSDRSTHTHRPSPTNLPTCQLAILPTSRVSRRSAAFLFSKLPKINKTSL